MSIMINHNLASSVESPDGTNVTSLPIANYSELGIIISNSGNHSSLDVDSSPPLMYYDATDKQGDPLVYVLAVLSFYILSIMILLLKYIRTQRQDETDMYNYNEFFKSEGVKYEPPVNRRDPELNRMRHVVENYYPDDQEQRPEDREGVRMTAV